MVMLGNIDVVKRLSNIPTPRSLGDASISDADYDALITDFLCIVTNQLNAYTLRNYPATEYHIAMAHDLVNQSVAAHLQKYKAHLKLQGGSGIEGAQEYTSLIITIPDDLMHVVLFLSDKKVLSGKYGKA